MAEHLRALVVVLLLAGAVMVAARPALAALMTATDFSRRRNAWLGLTLLAFLSHNFWVFVAGASLLLWTARRYELNLPALFWLLLFVVPPVDAPIPGFGLVNYLFELSFPRLLALLLLLPAALILWRNSQYTKLGSNWPDRLLLAYLVLSATLALRNANATQAMRETLYLVMEVLLPYYVFSRGLTQLSRIKEAMTAFVWAATLLAAIGMFELLRSWLLYKALPGAWGLHVSSAYLSREGLLRASATTGQAIVLGYAIAVGLGFYMALSRSVSKNVLRTLGWFALLGGLLAPLSRGPWVGAAAMAITYVITGPKGVRKAMALAAVSLATLPLLTLFPAGQKVIAMLPFVGSVETGNITYRQRLFENSLVLIERNFWLGAYDYRERLAAMGMVQGQGIVDIVNTYVRVAVEHGVLGLALFSLFFMSVLVKLRDARKRWQRHTQADDDDTLRVGRALFATMIGMLTIVATVSSISFIPWIYWTVAGAAVAYSQMINSQMNSAGSRKS